MHVIFSAGLTERQFPAKDGRPASTMWEQKGWIVEPAEREGEPDTSKPFTTMHRDQGEAYGAGVHYQLSAAHLEVNRYGRMEFNAYARFKPMDAPASAGKAPLSAQASASGPRGQAA